MYYRQSGENASLRIGAKPSSSNEAGVFHNTTVAEFSPANNGSASAFCGYVIYAYIDDGTGSYYYRSTGLGDYDYFKGSANVLSACRAYKSRYEEEACCNSHRGRGDCPKGWGNINTYNAFEPGCYYGTYYPNPVPAHNTDLFTGSLAHNHQSGNNTALRVGGGEPSGSSQAGVFRNVTAAETTVASHGAATDYCGRAFRTYDYKYAPSSYISIGLGKHKRVDYVVNVDPSCAAFAPEPITYAHCLYPERQGCCPLGWGTATDYENYRAGCYEGSYYPNPTPASNTDIHTGSLAVGSENRY